MAVNLGEDADTTGAIYGQLAGAYYGERAIPESWCHRIAHRLILEYFAERIYSIGKTLNWNRLVAYLPTFERPDFTFSEQVTSSGYAVVDPRTSTRTEIPYHDWSPEVQEFHDALYSGGFILPFFDWGNWHKEARRFISDSEALKKADELTLRRLLTAHARAERFSEGHFIEMFQSGHIMAILRRAKELERQR